MFPGPHDDDFLTDVDEVLADFVTPTIDAISHVLGRPWSLAEAPDDNWDMFGSLTAEQNEAVHELLRVKGFCSSLKPTPGSQDFVREVRKYRNLLAVTAPVHGPFWMYERTEWLGDHFGFNRKHIVFGHAKFICDGREFLDDNPDHVIQWRARRPNRRGMLWSTAHNKRLKGYDKLRVNSWEDVLRHVVAV